MSCLDMRERMLAVDSRDLRGMGDTPLASHIRECERCAAIARLLGAREDALVTQLRSRRETLRPRRRARRIARVGVGLIAAAALALLWKGLDIRNRNLRVALDPDATGLEVTPTDGSDAVISRTNAPDIVLVRLVPRARGGQ